MISPTIRSLVGVPYLSHGNDPARGFDCFTLVARVLKQDHGVDLFSHASSYDDSMADNTETIRRVAESGDWRRVPLEHAQRGDVLLLVTAGAPRHMGVVVADGMFAHASPGRGVTIERMDSTQWARRIHQVWRREP
jgi:cell wall-associated NlpC family hydrolase